MSPTLKKFVITAGLAALVVTIGVIARPGTGPKPAAAETPVTAPQSEQAPPSAPAAASTVPTTPVPTTPAASGAFSARLPAGASAAANSRIGSLDPAKAPFEIEFSPNGAGIVRITSADFWKSVTASRAAASARAGNGAMPSDDERQVLVVSRKLESFEVPALALRAVEVDGGFTSLFSTVWSADPAQPGVFATEIADASGKPVLRITRAFTLPGADAANRYLVGVSHTIQNLDSAPHTVRLVQYGPGDPDRDATQPIDARRFHFGYLYPPERDPTQSFVTANGQMYEHADVVKRIAANDLTLWPNTDSTEGKFGLVWFGSTDRYFAFAVHAPDAGNRRLEAIEEVRVITNGAASPNEVTFSTLWSPVRTVAAGEQTVLSMGVYAGPLDPAVLGGLEPYRALKMGELVVYAMSGCCSWCTFAWLADSLIWFLRFLHDYVVFDWGLAIIALVVIVRFVLHPVQKKSQISMQRFSRAMAAMKPELDSLQKKFKDDPARMQQEQMRMFKERGVSPVGCIGGLLPTFAQMPIWAALYASLYFAFELRQQAPFFGVFQQFGDWLFLADLSAQDNFVKFSQPIDLWLFSIASINLLPILMGGVFWIQQQYMTPPMPNQTEEQLAQQKMMKWMMVLLFPVMMYTVPSGLTLYIFTSTCIGIVEGRIIKKQVDAMDLSKPPEKTKRKQDFLGRMYEQALQRAQQREQKKKFKDR